MSVALSVVPDFVAIFSFHSILNADLIVDLKHVHTNFDDDIYVIGAPATKTYTMLSYFREKGVFLMEGPSSAKPRKRV